MTQSIAEKQHAIIESFSEFTDWEDRYREIIAAGKTLDAYPEDQRDETHKVKGCQSQVWLHAAMDEDGRVVLHADSDAHIVRGLLGLVVQVYSGHTPDEILATPPDFVDGLGLNDHLSQNRAFGLQAVLKQVRLYAMALKTLRERA
ncbi:MAG: SufE family protein [Planctomycetota bacterium]